VCVWEFLVGLNFGFQRAEGGCILSDHDVGTQRKGLMGWKRQYYRLLQDSLFQFTSHDSKTPTDEVTLMGMESHCEPCTLHQQPHPQPQTQTQDPRHRHPHQLITRVQSCLRVPFFVALSRVCLHGFSRHSGWGCETRALLSQAGQPMMGPGTQNMRAPPPLPIIP
jgi:hypothetical protein